MIDFRVCPFWGYGIEEAVRKLSELPNEKARSGVQDYHYCSKKVNSKVAIYFCGYFVRLTLNTSDYAKSENAELRALLRYTDGKSDDPGEDHFVQELDDRMERV